jgi:hypothetical protein
MTFSAQERDRIYQLALQQAIAKQQVMDLEQRALPRAA